MLQIWMYQNLLWASWDGLACSLVNMFGFGVINVLGGAVTTCKLDIISPLFLVYLPTPTRTRNEGSMP